MKDVITKKELLEILDRLEGDDKVICFSGSKRSEDALACKVYGEIGSCFFDSENGGVLINLIQYELE